MLNRKTNVKSIPLVIICLTGFLLLGLCVIGFISLDDEKMKDYAQAWDIPEASEALKSSPNEPSAHLAMASAWMKHKEFSKAISEYQKAIKLEPTNAYTYLDLGNAYAGSGQYLKARSQWQMAAHLDVPSGDAAKEASKDLATTASFSR